MRGYRVLPISYNETKPFILNIHYAKRIPSVIQYSFGLFYKSELVGMVSYGTPASPDLCKGICGEEYKHLVKELNRLVLINNIKNEASLLIGKSLKLLKKPLIIVSYADTSQNHTGYIYQATNFSYTGLSDKRTEWRQKNSDDFYLIARSRKHRYIYVLANKKDKKNLLKKLKYPILEYPKFQNKNYKTDTNIPTQRLLI